MGERRLEIIEETYYMGADLQLLCGHSFLCGGGPADHRGPHALRWLPESLVDPKDLFACSYGRR